MRPVASRARLLVGLLLAGQGLLVVTRVLDHEAPLVVGWLVLVAGLALCAWGRFPTLARGASSPARAWVVAGVGVVAVVGVLGYNASRGSTLGGPEVAILSYGVALVVASRSLDRRLLGTDVATLVAFSFPLVLAPLSLFAVNAAILSGQGATPLGWYIEATLVTPMAAALRWLQLDAAMVGDAVRIATPRGVLFLSVGVVCAGLYASVLFLGIFALFAWERRTPPARLAAYLAVGLVGLHVANVLRLVLLGVVGWKWGAEALQVTHKHAGWVLFLAWSVLFWAVVLRRFEGPGAGAVPVAALPSRPR